VSDVRDVVQQWGEILSPELLRHARHWVTQHDEFRAATNRVEALDHGRQASPPDVVRNLTTSLRALRAARHHLDELACELREVAADDLDRIVGRSAVSVTRASGNQISGHAQRRSPSRPSAGHLAGRVWAVEVVFTEDDDRTRADALLHGGDERGHGWGRATRDPDDPDVPVVGEEVAAARALADLSRQLLASATERVGRLEGQPVRIHR